MTALSNLKLLRDDMKENGENFVDIFDFSYNGEDYFVIVEVFEQESKPKYALAKLIFLRTTDITDRFEAWANSTSLDRRPYDIKKYFGISNFDQGIPIALQHLYDALGREIPTKFSNGKKEDYKKIVLTDYVVSSDPTDPNKRYCIGVRRTGGTRSQFNDEKTKLLRGALYNALGKYKEISFLYTDNQNKENDDATIIKNFENNSTLK